MLSAERLTLFQIVAAFPDGWLTSGQISREGKPPYYDFIIGCQDSWMLSLYSECDEEEIRERERGERIRAVTAGAVPASATFSPPLSLALLLF